MENIPFIRKDNKIWRVPRENRIVPPIFNKIKTVISSRLFGPTPRQWGITGDIIFFFLVLNPQYFFPFTDVKKKGIKIKNQPTDACIFW